MLLLESLAVALFVCPWRVGLRPPMGGHPGRAGLWVVRLLALKLMVLSGAVKLLSEDPTWADLTALEYHYWSQPIPTWTAWFVHHLGPGFHKISTILMFAGELALPWTMFGPRPVRLLGAWGMVGLLVGMAATGNYGYFHALTLVLLVPLFDDRHL